MGKPKEQIDVSKFTELASMLGELQVALHRLVQDCEANNVTAIELEGWPTLVRGFQFMIDQGKKIVGPLPLRNVDSNRLLMPGQSYAPTRKPSKAAADRKLSQARQQVADELKRHAKKVAEPQKPYTPSETPE